MLLKHKMLIYQHKLSTMSRLPHLGSEIRVKTPRLPHPDSETRVKTPRLLHLGSEIRAKRPRLPFHGCEIRAKTAGVHLRVVKYTPRPLAPI